jgi:hypothetical protein|tara:strand:+ start:386 stop:556 length:171 start_codon:yes stop_codon:yes gene_type:complete
MDEYEHFARRYKEEHNPYTRVSIKELREIIMFTHSLTCTTDELQDAYEIHIEANKE